MRSLAAFLLNSLVLPIGAVSGQRLILDGQNGQIIIYDASNNQRIIIGDSAGFRLSSSDPSETVTGHIDARYTIAPPSTNRRLALYADSPQFSGLEFATMLLASAQADDTPAGALVQFATTRFDLASLSNGVPYFTIDGFRALHVDSKEVTSDQTGITTATDLTGLSITFTAAAQQVYYVSGEAHFDSNTVSDRGILILDNDGTQVDEGRTDALPAGHIGKATISNYALSGISGSTTVKLRAQRNAGASTIAMRASTTRRAKLSVIGMGRAAA